MKLRLTFAFAPGLLLSSVSLPAEEVATPAGMFKQVGTILEQNCLECHNASKDKGKLRLDTHEMTLKGGDSGQALVPGKVEDSELFRRVILAPDDDEIMPPLGGKQEREAQKAYQH